MAEINLTAMQHTGGPDTPSPLGAYLIDHQWPNGGTVKNLRLTIGDSTITIWPADPDRIEELGDKLKAIAEYLRALDGSTVKKGGV